MVRCQKSSLVGPPSPLKKKLAEMCTRSGAIEEFMADTRLHIQHEDSAPLRKIRKEL